MTLNDSKTIMTEDQQEQSLQFMGIANIIASKYRNYHFYEDILQEIRYNICYAVATYNEDKGMKLSNWVFTCAKYAAGQFLRSWFHLSNDQFYYTSSLEQMEEDTPNKIQELISIRDFADDYVSNFLTQEWIPIVLDKMYKKEKASFECRKIYSEYIRVILNENINVLTAQAAVAKNFGVSRQYVNKIVKKYNALLKEELNEDKDTQKEKEEDTKMQEEKINEFFNLKYKCPYFKKVTTEYDTVDGELGSTDTPICTKIPGGAPCDCGGDKRNCTYYQYNEEKNKFYTKCKNR